MPSPRRGLKHLSKFRLCDLLSDFVRALRSHPPFRIPRSLADQSAIPYCDFLERVSVRMTTMVIPMGWSLSSKSTGRTDRHVVEGCGYTRRALVRLNNRAHLCYRPCVCGLDVLCLEYYVPRYGASPISSMIVNSGGRRVGLRIVGLGQRACRGRFL